MPSAARHATILQSDLTQQNMLVVGGNHVGAQLVGGLPEFVIQLVQKKLFVVVHQNP